MIFNSIKWRLQLWYGLVLVGVLVGFGVTAYQLEKNRMFRRVDEEIQRHFSVLAQQLHPPHRGPQGGRFQEGPPPEFADENQPPEDTRGPSFKLSPQAAALFDTNSPEQYYYVIWDPNGREIAHSANTPHDALTRQSTINQSGPTTQNGMNPADDGGPPGPQNGKPGSGEAPVPRTYGTLREIQIHVPSDERFLVGRNVTAEQSELQVTMLKLAGFGGIILLIGLAGGWFFVVRALRPISEISATATKIAAGELSQRINAGETESELGQLAAVLNSTFARLETAFAQQKQFASDAAHELRTPVSVILTQTQMALGRERDAAAYKQTVEACQRAAQRMRKLIETLLELARYDAGQEVLKRLNFDLSKTVADCVEMIQPLAGERGIKIAAELDAANVAGDSERLAQVITNLLTNAIQYNRPNGEVRLKLGVQNSLATLELADTGKGIPAKDLPHIFERFYRADKSRTGAGNSGLGLSICKSIVEAHGGTIEASSVENVGTRFVVRIPAGQSGQS